MNQIRSIVGIATALLVAFVGGAATQIYTDVLTLYSGVEYVSKSKERDDSKKANYDIKTESWVLKRYHGNEVNGEFKRTEGPGAWKVSGFAHAGRLSLAYRSNTGGDGTGTFFFTQEPDGTYVGHWIGLDCYEGRRDLVACPQILVEKHKADLLAKHEANLHDEECVIFRNRGACTPH